MTTLTIEVVKYEVADGLAREDTGIYDKMRRSSEDALRVLGFSSVGVVIHKVEDLGITYGAAIGVSEAELTDLKKGLKSEFVEKGLDLVAKANIEAAKAVAKHEEDDDEDLK